MASEKHVVRVAQKAAEDFLTALSYHQRVAGRASAERFISRYEDVIGYLEDVPTAAARIGNTDYRWLPVGSFVLVFRIDEQESTVYVARIVYRSSNWRDELEQGRV